MSLNLVLQCQANGAVSILWKYLCATEINRSFYLNLHARKIIILCKIKTVVAIPDQPGKERSEVRGWKPNHSNTLTSIHQLGGNIIPVY